MAGSFECVASCEIDKYAAAAYKALYNTEGEDFYSDITKINTENLADFDLLVGGFPCQPFSHAGRRLSFADPRGTLFFELARILEAKRPRYFIFENVPGLLSAQQGFCFAKILETLSELGYSVCWRVLDARLCVATHNLLYVKTRIMLSYISITSLNGEKALAELNIISYNKRGQS